MNYWQLDTRCVAILRYLTESNDTVTVQELSRFFNISVRSVYYDINKINDWLMMLEVPTLLIERNRGIYVTSIQSEKIRELLRNSDNSGYYVLSPKERQRIHICTLLSSVEPVYVETLSSLCDISRNTTFNDLKIVREKIARYGLELDYETSQGYKIRGPLMQQRAVFMYYFTPLIPLLENNQLASIDQLPFYDQEKVKMTLDLLKRIEEKLDTNYVEGMSLSLAVLITVIRKRQGQIDLTDIDTEDIVSTKEFAMVETHFDTIPQSEQIYIAMHLLGSRVQIQSVNQAKIQKPFILEIAMEMVLEFERLACLEFEDRDRLSNLIANHLAMSIYRYRYGIQIGNPLMNDILTSYPDLFDLTVQAARVLKDRLHMPIPDSEIAYITMHFGGFLQNNVRRDGECSVLIVCPNGISTATILRGEIESLHPNLKILDIVGVDGIGPYLQYCDFIVSTVDVNAPVPVIKVRPIITEDDRVRILSRVVNSAHIHKFAGGVNLESVLSVVSNYIHGDAYAKLKADLDHLYNPSRSGDLAPSSSVRLEDVLTQDRIRIVDKTEGWEDAIFQAAQPLLRTHTILPGYVDAMIQRVRQYGPYIVIGPQIALAHAMPKDGVVSLGMSLMISRSPIAFQDKTATLLFVLAPVDKISHLGIMKDLMTVISDSELVDKLTQAPQGEIIALMKSAIVQKGLPTYDD